MTVPYLNLQPVPVEIPRDPTRSGHESLAYKNNNPGNLRYAGQKNASPGHGGFALFASPEDGWNALVNQVRLDQSRGMPLAAFIAKFAPPAENDTARYLTQTAKQLGAAPEDSLETLDSHQLAAWLARMESGTKVPVPSPQRMPDSPGLDRVPAVRPDNSAVRGPGTQPTKGWLPDVIGEAERLTTPDLPANTTQLAMPGWIGGPKDPKLAEAVGRGIEAWHGSPHKFAEFSLDAIGSGEGAQAYGRGLYFAESRKVAESYREGLASWPLMRNGREVEIKSVIHDEAYWPVMRGFRNQMDDPYKYAHDFISNADKEGAYAYVDDGKNVADRIHAMIDTWKRQGVAAKQGGALYKVNLDVKPTEILNWEKTLAEQPLKVQEGVFQAFDGQHAVGGSWGGPIKEMTGRQAYYHLADYQGGFSGKSLSGASNALEQNGVQAIQYLDALSRNSAGRSTNNYVVLNAQRIKILETLSAAGVAWATDELAKLRNQPQPAR